MNVRRLQSAAAIGAAAAVLVAACTGQVHDDVQSNRTEAAPQDGPPPTVAPAPVPPPPPPPPDPLRHRDDLPPAKRAILHIDGETRSVDVDAARMAGYDIVDFRDDWTPYIFEEFRGEDGRVLQNRYRQIYIGLANDDSDGDGQPLPEGERNYLELFGIPPSISVLRERFVADTTDEARTCFDEVDFELLSQYEKLPNRQPARQARFDRRVAKLRRDLEKARRQAEVDDLDALVEVQPELADDVSEFRLGHNESQAFAAVERRLQCEGVLSPKSRGRRRARGKLDWSFKVALRRFQRENMIYSHPHLLGRTMRAMAKPPSQLNYESFVRALTERVIDAGRIIEDGSVERRRREIPTWRDSTGRQRPVRNLVDEFLAAAATQIGVDSPESLEVFFRDHPPEDFEWLRFAVKFPPRPEYHRDHMELHLEIDRGDVYYDPPWDETGKWRHPKRERLPKLTLYVDHEGQRIPLAYWPTTIGGWRAEQHTNGYEYYKYKGSEVGPRIIRKILSGPVWVPPESTPIRGLTKVASVNGKRQRIVNYAEFGPGYESAYGMVAGYFVIPGKGGRSDWDRGIRAHGSSDYMSIQSQRGFSHGCHRMLNHLAVRLYDFTLTHRHKKIVGDQVMNMSRQFLDGTSVYEIRMPSRGFEFELDPPMTVEVLEGRIKGSLKEPIEEMVPKPGERYPEPEAELDEEEAEAG